jgi:uncharacterized protein (TIGR02611 family)
MSVTAAMPRFRLTSLIRALTAHAWRTVIFLFGLTIVMLGVVLLPLPGPGTIVVVLGLGVLSVEFAWAQHTLDKVKRAARRVRDKAQRKIAAPRLQASAAPVDKRRRPLRVRRPIAR